MDQLIQDVSTGIFARLGRDAGLKFFAQFTNHQDAFSYDGIIKQATTCIQLAAQAHPFDWERLGHNQRIQEAGLQWRPLAIGLLTQIYSSSFGLSPGQSAAWATTDVDEPVELSGVVQRRLYQAQQNASHHQQPQQLQQHEQLPAAPAPLALAAPSPTKTEVAPTPGPEPIDPTKLALALANRAKKTTLQGLYRSLRGNSGGGRSKQDLALAVVAEVKDLEAHLQSEEPGLVTQLYEDLFPHDKGAVATKAELVARVVQHLRTAA